MRKSKGFTLVELLVVIAIIGILSSVVFASLSSARGKARIANAQQTLHNVQAIAVSCVLATPATALNIGANETPSTWTGSQICTGTGVANYPALPTGWVYCDGAAGGCATISTSDTTAGTFTIGAAGDGRTITCTESGCTTT